MTNNTEIRESSSQNYTVPHHSCFHPTSSMLMFLKNEPFPVASFSLFCPTNEVSMLYSLLLWHKKCFVGCCGALR